MKARVGCVLILAVLAIPVVLVLRARSAFYDQVESARQAIMHASHQLVGGSDHAPDLSVPDPGLIFSVPESTFFETSAWSGHKTKGVMGILELDSGVVSVVERKFLGASNIFIDMDPTKQPMLDESGEPVDPETSLTRPANDLRNGPVLRQVEALMAQLRESLASLDPSRLSAELLSRLKALEQDVIARTDALRNADPPANHERLYLKRAVRRYADAVNEAGRAAAN